MDPGTSRKESAYDLLGNRTSYTGRYSATTTYTSNTANQYTAIGGQTPAYDEPGNMTADEKGYMRGRSTVGEGLAGFQGGLV